MPASSSSGKNSGSVGVAARAGSGRSLTAGLLRGGGVAASSPAPSSRRRSDVRQPSSGCGLGEERPARWGPAPLARERRRQGGAARLVAPDGDAKPRCRRAFFSRPRSAVGCGKSRGCRQREWGDGKGGSSGGGESRRRLAGGRRRRSADRQARVFPRESLACAGEEKNYSPWRINSLFGGGRREVFPPSQKKFSL